jgi:hypothetical protein
VSGENRLVDNCDRMAHRNYNVATFTRFPNE